MNIADVALKALENVDALIGWEKGDEFCAKPAIVKSADDVSRLIISAACSTNLVRFLSELTGEYDKIAIFVKGCDAKSLERLVKEGKIERDRLYILGVPCRGVVDAKKAYRLIEREKIKASLAKLVEEEDSFTISDGEKSVRVSRNELLAACCLTCRNHNPEIYDVLIGEPVERAEDDFSDVKQIEAMSIEERWIFWSSALSRCIRCFACREVCPLCYCKECLVDPTNVVVTPATSAYEKAYKPMWISRAAELQENIIYHLTRAMHLAGRCADCGECERACPMEIPIRLLMRKVEKDSIELFGTSEVFAEVKEDDPGEFII
ncbi:Coenzyme F420 hydrogenase/dehydrogenase, beta subunit C-terminal domain [Archaeoglobus veneficus]|uniref:4Fe-4S ferredoxin iron-sulfur binding domain-containing protein n=1 Tax=Archaeoglobus veneficus (strain DSM 11195 / SNP6) TaxID=693661 RepID=F2KSM6_ARCVS|nr:Coenzyme F420 hydrogenase/dehydrogenase, beta subunit C-terminal domain [Archaeoglobus veneficus]AEA48096.1 4Fe-4S ferredoxin iron-sulfur binding domain-containing protein [Archaeoglobus veneficus SNP6]